jgi:hypothetical protein
MEPSRRGASRGEPLGFSKKKYIATLYFLTAEKQISIAMEQGLSYGLLRKWKTEEPFKTLVRKHCQEFADAFIEHVLERYEKKRRWHKENPDVRLTENVNRTPGQSDDAFRDSGDYSPDLQAEILRAVVTYAQKAEKTQSFSEAFTVLSAFLAIIAPAVKEKAMREIVRHAGIDLSALARGLKLGVVERVKEVIVKEHITVAEREDAYYLLTELEAII